MTALGFRQGGAARPIRRKAVEDVPRAPETATTTELPPRRIAQRYRLEALIGGGGMGVVYAAMDETLGRPVAIKLVREDQLRGPDALERFQHEARLAASLSHSNIVTVHDFGVDVDGAPYLVMERLLGRSLRTALGQEQRFAPDRALAIVQGVASAIEAAHAKGMVHRDLKPENIFLVRVTQMTPASDQFGSISNFASSSTELAKVLDFGIAKTEADSRAQAAVAAATGVPAGTLRYMSPEQLAGGTAAPAWDVWSLAVIAYEMLSGVNPFSTPRGSGMPLVVPGQPMEVDAFFERALSLDASRRPATALALAADLRAALAGTP